ncbi:MAG TPA: T9SS type B sorting domain-containing protein, partial [Flavitalea sp.]|nr:T9SS type B sorting domain-containing protein [Flavitalea sp.]
YQYKLGAAGAYQNGGIFDKLAAGDHTVTVKDAAGCTKDTTVNIAASGTAPAGTISPATVDPVCTGTSQTLTASAGTSFQWFLNDVAIAGATAQTHKATEAGRYTVTISNGTCSTKATNTVALIFKSCTETEVFVPKAFTPNNNNKNDKLTPRFINVKEFKYFRIYNRWGQLIFQTNVNGEGWDGTFKGVRQPMETYNWILECIDDNGENIKKSGKTILIR